MGNWPFSLGVTPERRLRKHLSLGWRARAAAGTARHAFWLLRVRAAANTRAMGNVQPPWKGRGGHIDSLTSWREKKNKKIHIPQRVPANRPHVLS